MDRRSFINANQLTKTGSCQLENCNCDETGLTGRTQLEGLKPLHLAAISVAAFVFAVGVLIIKVEAAKATAEAFIWHEKDGAIYCSHGSTPDTLNNDQQPSNRSSGNGCPHQFNNAAVMITNDYKRKKNNNC